MSFGKIKNSLNFFRSYFSKYPSYLILFVTARCNARCKHCFYWEEIESSKAQLEMKIADFNKIAKSLNLIYLSIGGGEPFIRNDLPEIIKCFYEKSNLQYCNIVTNGFYTERTIRDVKEIRKLCPSIKLKIQISIDDFEEEHDENRKVEGIYMNAINTLKQLSKIRESDNYLNIDIATCMTKTNKERITQLYDHLRGGNNFDDYQILYPRGNAKDEHEKEVDADEWWESLQHIQKRSFQKNHNPIIPAVNRIAKQGIYKFLKSGVQSWDCLAGRKFISITEQGVLQPCEVLNQIEPELDSDMAILKNYDFNVRKALDSKKALETTNWIKKNKCSCSFECAASCNVAFTKKEALKALKLRFFNE